MHTYCTVYKLWPEGKGPREREDTVLQDALLMSRGRWLQTSVPCFSSTTTPDLDLTPSAAGRQAMPTMSKDVD